MAPSQADVCVVGGGPAGLLLGLLLAKRGVRVIVLEGHETFDREFRGEVLQPSTVRLLDELGLLEYVLAQPHLNLTTGRLLVNGRPAGGFDFRYIAPRVSLRHLDAAAGLSRGAREEGRRVPGVPVLDGRPRHGSGPGGWRHRRRPGPAARRGAVRGPGRRGGGRRRPPLHDQAAGRVRHGVRARRLRRDLVHRRAPTGLAEDDLLLGRQGAAAACCPSTRTRSRWDSCS